MGTLSFNGNKLITTGGGGALITNDDELAQRARHLSTTAKLPHPWAFVHDSVGWNDRLPNLNAALGVAQLEDLERRLEVKRQLAECYSAAVRNLEDVELVAEPYGCRSNYWLVTLRFTAADPAEAKRQRLHLLESAHASGLLLRRYGSCCISCRCMKRRAGLFSVLRIALRLVNLPRVRSCCNE